MRLGLVKPGDKITPPQESFTDNLQGSVKGVSPELRQKLQAEFGDRIVIEGDTARWSGPATTRQPPQSPISDSTARPRQATVLSTNDFSKGQHQPGEMANARRSLESAAADVRGSQSSAPAHDESRTDRMSRIRREEDRLRPWAEERGLLIDRTPPDLDLHGEHGVYHDESKGRYFKVTRGDRHQGYGIALGSHLHGASPAEYLDRLVLQNSLFDDDIRLEWISPRPNRKLAIVSSQPDITGEPARPGEIDVLMESKGFTRLTDGAFLDPGNSILVFDMFPRNVVRSPDGTLYPIDPVIQRVTPEFAEFLRNNPERINDRP